MADGLLYPWVQAGNFAWLSGLKAKPELNGQGVNILSFDRRSERWLCKVKSSGEEIKVRAQSLAEHEPAKDEMPEEEETTKDVEWLRKGVHAVVHGQEEHQNQIVRVLLVGVDGQCTCHIRATGEQITVDQGNLRPLAGSTPKNTQDTTQTVPTNGNKQSDWAAVELERRKLAEGFRAGFEEGATVVLQGLSSQELNGKSGHLVKWDSQSLRWQVKIEGMGENKALRPANLVAQGPEGPSRKRKNAE
mmetsp:Transcript_30976/g.60821  ORF Transcript_30976/g.60821 Transcript_30976/m.60821 type:complete len:247 (-) Transcript_30976:116-856(-)